MTLRALQRGHPGERRQHPGSERGASDAVSEQVTVEPAGPELPAMAAQLASLLLAARQTHEPPRR